MKRRPLQQQTIGLLGGCSDVATGYYYRFLNEAANRRLGGWDIAETLIVGMNFGNIEAMVRQDDWLALEEYLRGKVDQLIAGGADMLICASNTLHRPLKPVLRERDIPFIHIADPTGTAIRAQGLRHVALIGTQPVMKQPDLRSHFEHEYGLDISVPMEDEIADIDRIIFDELVKGNFRPASKARYLEIIERLRREDGAQGVILGCTEIFLMIEQQDLPGFPVFNTALLHCEAAIEAALGV